MIRAVYAFVTILRAGSGLCLMTMVLLTCADVAGGIFGHPVLGSEELVGLLGSLLLAFSLPYAHLEKAHVGVEIIFDKFPRPLQIAVDLVTRAASTIFFFLAAWQSYRYAAEMKRVGLVSTTVQFPIHWVISLVCLACLILALVMVLEFFLTFKEDARG
jgi:TRAP-type C4-dicarboxylate transport system permease small subunit